MSSSSSFYAQDVLFLKDHVLLSNSKCKEAHFIKEERKNNTNGQVLDIELRIIEFLDLAGIEYTSPVSKMYDYYDKIREKNKTNAIFSSKIKIHLPNNLLHSKKEKEKKFSSLKKN